MKRLVSVFALASITGICFGSGVVTGQTPRVGQGTTGAVNAVGDPTAQKALLDKYCVTCHNPRVNAGNLKLDAMNLSAVPEGAEVWERVIRKVRAGTMPPAGRPRPEPAEYVKLATYLETEIDRAAVAHPNPGRTETLHRLNRAEYHNAVRDLFAIDINTGELVPDDDASYGFDNIAGVLKLNQLQLERYLSAARVVATSAIGESSSRALSQTFAVSREMPQYEQVEGLPFGTRGGTLVHFSAPRDGEYEIKVQMLCTVDRDLKCDAEGGFTEDHRLIVLVDGTPVQTWELKARPDEIGYRLEWANRFKVHVPLKAGVRDIGVTFAKGPSFEYVRAGYRKRFERPYVYYPDHMQIAVPFLDTVQIAGPYNAGGISDTPSRKAIFTCGPAAGADDSVCARSILSRLAKLAYRQPVAAEDLAPLMEQFTAGKADGGFEEGINRALQRMLVSTKFLFRVERQPASAKPGQPYRISDLELASRLSFFLWSSIPDAQLLNLGIQGRLHETVVLRAQVKRMLADPRSSALVENFFGQWLQLRHLETIRPLESMFPDFEQSLRDAFRKETELFVDYIMRNDRSVMEMLTADYTFVNDRLARHYGIPYVQGIEFRKVTYPDGHRRGLLGQGSVLALTSRAIRTAPVLRGKWILENVLGAPPPPPPANVPPFPEDKEGGHVARSVREKMAAHRANPVCASCHGIIDPAGFALENFNAVGQWRDVDEAFHPIDASGTLPDGSKFSGLDDFRALLLQHPERFVSNFAEKLMVYALGRGVEYYDEPAIRTITREAAADNYRFSSIVLGIVNSLPFEMRRGEAPAPVGKSASR
jgi:mono/diheme cytochrome c family protein